MNFVKLFVILCILPHMMPASVSAAELQITIETNNREMPTASNLPIKVTYTNTTANKIDLPIAVRDLRDVTDILEVHGPDGKLIEPFYGLPSLSSKIDWGHKSLAANESRSFFSVLYPSEYGFTVPGTYSIRMKRSPGAGMPVIYSNSLRIRVVGWNEYIDEENAKPEMQIHISTDSQDISKGGSIEIHELFTNISDHQIDFLSSDIGGLDDINQFDVQGPDGKVISPFQGPHPELLNGSTRVAVHLQPKESTNQNMQFECRNYGCKKAGPYRVRVCRGRYQTHAPSVCSNTIVIKVMQNVPAALPGDHPM